MTKRQLLLSAGLAMGLALTAGLAVRVTAQEPAAPAAVPAAPSGLTYYTNGGAVSLVWTAPPANFTHYVLEAGGGPGETFFVFPTNVLQDHPDPNFRTFPHLLSVFNANGIGAGDYYVRVRAANGEGSGPVSNEVRVPVRAGCSPAGPPTNLTAIVRGDTARIQWNLGSGGLQRQFHLIARTSPNDPPVAVFPTNQFFFNVAGVPGGPFYVSVVTEGRCGGISAESNQIVVTAGVNSPETTPNPSDGGRLPMPYIFDVVQQFHNENRAALAAESCLNPNQKYNRNPWLDRLVDRLRTLDKRFGYNKKPTRGPGQNGGAPVVVAGDEIAYHFGADAPEGSANAYLIDVISQHCGSNPALTYRPFTFSEYGQWTSAGGF